MELDKRYAYTFVFGTSIKASSWERKTEIIATCRTWLRKSDYVPDSTNKRVK
jgi:hypothetical protein